MNRKFIPLKESQKEQAKKTNLISFLSSKHPEIIVFNSTKKRFEHIEHDSLVISEFAWHQFSTNKGGDTIEFLVQWLNYHFTDAVLELCRFNGLNGDLSNVSSYRGKDTTKSENGDSGRFWIPQRSEKHFHNVETYLMNRGISKKTIQTLKENGILYSDSYSNCCFINDTMTMIFQRGTQQKEFKKIITKEQFAVWMFKPFKEIKTIYICESPIDAISLFELCSDEKKQNAAFASIQGLKAAAVNTIWNTYKEAEIKIAVDWDDAGETFFKEKFPFFKRMKAPQQYQNQCKDWNELLQIKNKERKNKK